MFRRRHGRVTTQARRRRLWYRAYPLFLKTLKIAFRQIRGGIGLDAWLLKEKDAWDIWLCLRPQPDGFGQLIETVRPHVEHGLIQEALSALEEKFSIFEQVGPQMVADVDQITDEEARP